MKRLVLIALLVAPSIALAQPGRLSPQGGTITEVVAGTGLTGGGTSGSVTLNVICGTGLICAADSISVSGSYPIGSGTLNVVPLWTPNGNALGNSIISQSGSAITVAAAAGTRLILQSTTAGNNGANIRWRNSVGSNLWTMGVDFNGTGTSDFWLFDNANSLTPLLIDQAGTSVLSFGTTSGGLEYDNATQELRLFTNGSVRARTSTNTFQVLGDVIAQDDLIAWDGLEVGTVGAGPAIFHNNTTLGDSSTDAHTLVGTLNANSTVGSSGQVLTIVGGLPKWQSLTASSWTEIEQTISGGGGNNIALNSDTTILHWNNAGVNTTITGFTGGGPGRRFVLDITDDAVYTIATNNAGSSVGNRIYASSDGSYIVRGPTQLDCAYDNTNIRWVCSGGVPRQLPTLTVQGGFSTQSTVSLGNDASDVTTIFGSAVLNSAGGNTNINGALIANATASVSSWLNAGTVYSGSNGFACARTTNGDATCHISAVAFNNNAGVTRNLQINDGLGSTLGTHSIAYFNGADHSTTLYGVAAVNKKSLLSALASPANTVLALEQTDGTDMHLHMRGTGNKYLSFGNSSNATDGYIWYSTSRNMLFGVLNAVRLVIDSSGPIRMGDGGGSTVPNNIDVLTIGNTGTGQTASGTALARLTHTGTFNAASNLEVDGLNVSVAATRASGSNMVRNRAIVADAADNPNTLGAAITTLRGWNHFNTAGGASRFYGSLFADSDVVLGTDTTNNVTINSSINRVVHYRRADTDLSCSSAACTLTDYSGDERGRIVCTDTNATGSCTVSFSTPFTDNPPACILQLESSVEGPTPTISSISTSSFTFQFQDSGPQAVTYHCDGMTEDP